jgi:hypothetical protein
LADIAGELYARFAGGDIDSREKSCGDKKKGDRSVAFVRIIGPRWS